jgi:hypothetical protein
VARKARHHSSAFAPARYISTPITSATTTPMRMPQRHFPPLSPPSPIVAARIIVDREAEKEDHDAEGYGERAEHPAAVSDEAVGDYGQANEDQGDIKRAHRGPARYNAFVCNTSYHNATKRLQVSTENLTVRY